MIRMGHDLVALLSESRGEHVLDLAFRWRRPVEERRVAVHLITAVDRKIVGWPVRGGALDLLPRIGHIDNDVDPHAAATVAFVGGASDGVNAVIVVFGRPNETPGEKGDEPQGDANEGGDFDCEPNCVHTD